VSQPINLTPSWKEFLRRREAELLPRVRAEIVRLRELYPRDPDRMPRSLSYFSLISIQMELEALGEHPDPIGRH